VNATKCVQEKREISSVTVFFTACDNKFYILRDSNVNYECVYNDAYNNF